MQSCPAYSKTERVNAKALWLGLAGLFLVASSAGFGQSVSAEAKLTLNESHLLTLLNHERQQRDLAPLAVDSGLVDAARKHTHWMVREGALSHGFSGEPQLVQRFADAGVRFDSAGENVADAPDIDGAHEDLMLSPPHRANILSTRYNAVGIGIATASDNQIYVTEDFAHVTGQYSKAQIEDDVYTALNRVRAKNKLPLLTRRKLSMLEQEACRDQVNAKAIGNALSLAAWVGVFTSSDPNELPGDIIKLAQHRDARSVALGACFPPSSQQSYSLFQAVVVFFREAE